MEPGSWTVVYLTATILINYVTTHDYCPMGCTCTPTGRFSSIHFACSSISASQISTPETTQSITHSSVPTLVLNSDHFASSATHLLSISWQESTIQQISKDTFRQMRQLRELDLSHNNIASIDNIGIEHLTDLRILNFTDNSIKKLSSTSFPPNVQELYMRGNLIEEIDPNAFKIATSCELIDISSNRIGAIGEYIFSNNLKLKHLNISNNNIRNLRTNIFKYLVDLKTLDCSNNEIQVLDENLFANLNRMEYLDLSGTLIQWFPPRIFKNLNMLTYMNIGNNMLEELPPLIFKYNDNLRTLILENTNIKKITNDNMYGLINLNSFSIKDNQKLREIQTEAFSYAKDLEYLNMENIHLTTLPKSLNKLINLKVFSIDETEIECNCETYWYMNWKWKEGRETDQDSICRGRLRQTCLKSQMEEIKRLVVELGTATLIFCNETSSLSNISWTTPTGNHRSSSPLDRVHLLPNGTLHIKHMLREDSGLYICQSIDTFNTKLTYYVLQLDPITFNRTKIMSILTGIFSALGFLTLTVVIQMFRKILKRCGCCSKEDSSNGKQIFQILESVEQYKTQQLDRLRENYTQQVHKIKENCAQQVEWICESYQNQVQNLKDIRDYGTSHLPSMKIKRVKEYSNTQLSWVRENYVFQRNRIRKFSSHQVLRFRESYKYQQATLNKLLENLPSLHLDNCRNGSCSKSDSVDSENQAETDFEVYIKSDSKYTLDEPLRTVFTGNVNSECQSIYYSPMGFIRSPRTPPYENYLKKLTLIPDDTEPERMVLLDKKVHPILNNEDDQGEKHHRYSERRSVDFSDVHYEIIPQRTASLPELKPSIFNEISPKMKQLHSERDTLKERYGQETSL